MDLFSPEFWSALLAIVLIDLVLAGDNAIVIGLAARNVPKAMQKKVIFWGTAGAIIIRALLTLVVVWLLKIPGFLLAGGLALVWIAMKLVKPEDEKDGHHIESHDSVRKAIQTIVIADAVMGVDNVLAIGGAAHGSMILVITGLLISVPIVVWGSQLILQWVEKYPSIIMLGAGVLGWTAVKMIASEPLIKDVLTHSHQLRILLYVIVLGLILVPPLSRRLPENKRILGILLPFLIVWLTGFDLLEEHYHLHPLDEWFWIDDVVDLVMWIGWIPPAIWLYRKYSTPTKSQLES